MKPLSRNHEVYILKDVGTNVSSFFVQAIVIYTSALPTIRLQYKTMGDYTADFLAPIFTSPTMYLSTFTAPSIQFIKDVISPSPYEVETHYASRNIARERQATSQNRG